MKRWILLLLFILMLPTLLPTSNSTVIIQLPPINYSMIYDHLEWNMVQEPVENYVVIKKTKKSELYKFLKDIGHRESTNTYDTVNTLGYMGCYQVGQATLKGLGIKISKEDFLNNPEFQDKTMIKLLLHNKSKLQKYIDYWDGKRVHGQIITESGILAAAHLAGQGNVKRFFKFGDNPQDNYKTKLTTYLHEFSGYALQLN